MAKDYGTLNPYQPTWHNPCPKDRDSGRTNATTPLEE